MTQEERTATGGTANSTSPPQFNRSLPDHSDAHETIFITSPRTESDRAWLASIWRTEWGGETMVTRGTAYQLSSLHARIAWVDEERVGVATYRLGPDTCALEAHSCELMSLNALVTRKGIGTALLNDIEEVARTEGCTRVWLITSNDNLDALRFYQRRGYRFVAVYPGAIDEARKIKPGIPDTGYHGIPVRDEIELEKRL